MKNVHVEMTGGFWGCLWGVILFLYFKDFIFNFQLFVWHKKTSMIFILHAPI